MKKLKNTFQRIPTIVGVVVLFAVAASALILTVGASMDNSPENTNNTQEEAPAVSTIIPTNEEIERVESIQETDLNSSELSRTGQVDAQFTTFRVDSDGSNIVLTSTVESFEEGTCTVNYAPLEGGSDQSLSFDFETTTDQPSGLATCNANLDRSGLESGLYYVEIEYMSAESSQIGISDGRIFTN